MNKNIDNFALIIGAMKSGTTSLFYYLAEHPEVAPIEGIEGKEPHFFSYTKNFNRGIDWYRAKWNCKPEHKVALEGSTTYAMYPKYGDVASRIASVENANFKFIYVIRNPFRRIESHMVHLLAGGHQKKPELIEEHISYTEYAKQINQFVDRFGRQQVHILFLEDLQEHPQRELEKICNFLEIDSNYQFQRVSMIRNSKQTLNLNPIVRNIYRLPLVKYFARLISPEIRQRFYAILARKQSYTVNLSKQEQEMILKRLNSDLKQLKTVYDLDVYQKWNLDNICQSSN